jgi:hypothetical protein
MGQIVGVAQTVGSLRSVKVAHHFAKVGVEGSIPRGGSIIQGGCRGFEPRYPLQKGNRMLRFL